MKRVLMTGMSGTGKSTVVAALAARGHKAVDADEPGFSELVSVPEGELTGPGPGKDRVWREDRIQALLATQDADVLFVSGCTPNQGKFDAQFDQVVLLTAPAAVIAKRLATRTRKWTPPPHWTESSPPSFGTSVDAHSSHGRRRVTQNFKQAA